MKDVVRVFWDDWDNRDGNHIFVLYEDGTFENIIVKLGSGGIRTNDNRKQFTKFRKFARISTFGIGPNKKGEITGWLNKKVMEFREKEEKEWEKNWRMPE